MSRRELVTRYPHAAIAQTIPALEPRDASGVQFLVYGDCCSGVPGAPHEANFAAVNAIAARLWPPPFASWATSYAD